MGENADIPHSIGRLLQSDQLVRAHDGHFSWLLSVVAV